MEENLNIFGKNQGEIGSLEKNLVLRTRGQIYIRYGKKYIELLDSNGNLKVKVPKVLTKINSKDKMTKTGFYLLDGNLYICYEGEIIQITGNDGQYVEYRNSQKLTQEQIATVQQNIGLTFPTIEDAQKSITEGIVFIENKIYYISNGNIQEIPLTGVIKNINNSELSEHPSKDNSVILWKNGRWDYDIIVTKDDFDQYKKNQKNNKEEEKEQEEEITSIFDPIQYSSVYTLNYFTFNTKKISDSESITSSVSFDTIPQIGLNEDDILILSVNVYYVTKFGNNIIPQTQQIYKTYRLNKSQFTNLTEESIVKYAKESKGLSNVTYTIDDQTIIITGTEEAIIQDIYTFNLKYKGKESVFINSSGEELSYPISIIKYQGYQTIVLDIEDKSIAFKYQEDSFNGKHLYVKAEQSKPHKFKIDYENAEIALEENTVKEGKINITPHTILGDLDNKSKYYNLESFRTYTEKESSQGLFSDQPVFIGSEFRHPFEYEEDINVENFPRYSKELNNILCDKHTSDEEFDEVIPTIKYIKSMITSSVPVGTIIMYGGVSVPEGWLMCNGSTFSQSDYSELYTVLGTNKIPDLRDRFIVGAGNEYSLGNIGGEKTHTLTIDEIPKHSHTKTVNIVDGDGWSFDNNKVSTLGGATQPEQYTWTSGYAGEGKEHENRPPYYALYFIIKAI